jgi:hypothetical protein
VLGWVGVFIIATAQPLLKDTDLNSRQMLL